MFSNPKGVLNQFHVDPGMSVADFGVGGGHYSIEAADRVENVGKVYAFDVQKDLLNKLKNEANSRNLENINTIWADLDEPKSTQLADESIDRVIITNILFQTEDRPALIREAKRILKPNGKILVVDWTDSHGGLGPKQSEIISPEAAKSLVEENGFIVEKDVQAGDHHYGFIAKLN